MKTTGHVVTLAAVLAVVAVACGGTTPPAAAPPETPGAIPPPPANGFHDTGADACDGGDATVEMAFLGRVVSRVDGGPAPWVTFEIERWFTDDLGPTIGLWSAGWDGQESDEWLVASTRYQAGLTTTGDVIPCETTAGADAARTEWERRWDGSVAQGRGQPEEPADGEVLARIDEAEERWRVNAPGSWTATIFWSSRESHLEDACGVGPVRVVVRDEAVVQAIDLRRDCEVPAERVPTMEALFEEARRTAGAIEGEILFNDQFGFVRSMYAVDRSVEVSISVEEFAPRALLLADDGAEALADARRRWKAEGIDDYELEVSVQCFCAVMGRIVVTVVDGAVTELEALDGGGPPEEFRDLLTVESLFDQIGEAQETGDVDVAYDPELGFPITASLDPVLNGVDDEIQYHVRRLEPNR